VAAHPGIPGVAHGAAGTVYAALKASQRFATEPAPATVAELLRLGDAPPLPDAGWCRGRAGMVYLWALAHEMFGDARFLALAERDARAAFEHPDGHPNLCCGLAGRALALVHWYQRTGETSWLRRARALARRAGRAASCREAPLGLFGGGAGIALVDLELEAPEHARMPLFN
jgi:serine/threonine-protein kinase